MIRNKFYVQVCGFVGFSTKKKGIKIMSVVLFKCFLFTFMFLAETDFRNIKIPFKSVQFLKFKTQNSSQYVPQGCNHLCVHAAVLVLKESGTYLIGHIGLHKFTVLSIDGAHNIAVFLPQHLYFFGDVQYCNF